MEIKREHQINIFYIVAALLAVMAIQTWLYQPTHVKEIPYSEFQRLADQGKVTDLVISQTTITGTLKDASEKEPQHFVTNRVDTSLAEALAKNNLTFSGESGP